MACKYKILTNSDYDDLEKEVCKYLEGGWRLCGGVSTATLMSSTDICGMLNIRCVLQFSQAMTRQDGKTN